MNRTRLVLAVAAAVISLPTLADTETLVSSAESGSYTQAVAKTFGNIDLHYVKRVSATFLTSYGSYGNNTYTIDTLRAVTDSNYGIFYWEPNTTCTQITYQVQVKDQGYLRGIQMKLVQNGADVKATVIGHYYQAYDPYGVDFRTKSEGGDWYNEAFPTNNTQSCPMALLNLQLVVSDVPQVALDDQWDGAGFGIVAGDVLTWNGGAQGSWSGTEASWLTTNAAPTRWVKGCRARFVNDTAISLPNYRDVAGLVVGASSVTMTGAVLNVADMAEIRYDVNSTLRFENKVVCAGQLLQRRREIKDVEAGLVPSAYLLKTAERKVLPADVKLASISVLRCKVDNCWGTPESVPRQLSTVHDPNKDGLYDWTYDSATDTATCKLKVKVTDSYGTIIDYVKISFTQKEDGVYAIATATKNAGGSWDLNLYGQTGHTSTWQIDFDAGAYRADCALYDQATTLTNYKLHVYDFRSVVADVAPTGMVTAIANDFAATGKLVVSNGVFKVVDNGLLGGGVYGVNTTVHDGATFSFESAAHQISRTSYVTKGTGCVVIQSGSDVDLQDDGNQTIWDLKVFGSTTVSGYRTLPNAMDNGVGKTTICPGGVLSLGNINGYWGPQGGGELHVQTNGLMVLRTADSIGVSQKVFVDGGVITNAVTNAVDRALVYKMQMRDGAKLVGSRLWAGFIDYYDSWSYIEVMGALPSIVEVNELCIGYQFPATSSKKVGLKFDVSDVTGDGRTDLTVGSALTRRPNVPLYDAGCITNAGLWKLGLGTVELTSPDNCCTSSVFKLEAGTVRLGATCAGKLGAFLLLGNATVDCAGGSVAFDDSRDMVWTSGAKLTVTGTLGKRTLRFGTSAGGLTASQVASIVYNGKTGKCQMSNDGYLRTSIPLVITLR